MRLRPVTAFLVSAVSIIFCGSLLPYQKYKSHNNHNKKRTTVGSSSRSGRGYDRLNVKPRRLVNNASDPVIRMGSCPQVPYGKLIWEAEVDPKELPLNELLIHLDHPAYVSPPNQYGTEFGPVIVDIGLYVIAICDLNPGEETFSMEGYMDMVWCDTRLQFNSTTHYNQKHIYLETDAAKELEKIWWPDITFVNEISNRVIENQELIIEQDGTVEYREKFGVQLASNFDMHKFPFDKQVLTAEIESFAWNASVLQFHVEQDLVGFSDEFDIPEYKLNGIDEHLEIKKEARDRHPFSDLVTELYVERNPAFYVTKVIVPLCLIVGISWAVFWMDGQGQALGDRMAVSFTGVLTAIAYQFVVAETLPPHIYNTFLDNFVLLSFFQLTLTVVINVGVHQAHDKGYSDEAYIVDKVCRILFPAMFVLGALFLAGVQVFSGFIPAGATLVVSLATLLTLSALVGYLMFKGSKKKEHRKASVRKERSAIEHGSCTWENELESELDC